MSFFSKLFTRKVTYIDTLCRDKCQKDVLHVFGARRVMPEDGDSYDIWRHCVIDLNTFYVTNGLEQTGNEFSTKSPYAKRAVEHMSSLLGKQLALLEKKEEDDEDVYADDYVPSSDGPNLEDHCEVEIRDRTLRDSDTAEPRKSIKNGLVFTEMNIGERERFSLAVIKSGVELSSFVISGDADYFRHVLHIKESNRLLVTFRKTGMLTSGGMGFLVLDYGTGEKLHEGYLC